MHDKFPFGRYAGHSSAVIGLKDYQWLIWISNKGIQRTDLRKDTERVRFALNNFTPKGTCLHCKAPAQKLSIATSQGKAMVEDIYVFCDKERCWSSYGLEPSNQLIRPICFDSMLEFSQGGGREPKYALKSMQTTLNELAGITGKITEKRAQQFIDDLIEQEHAAGKVYV